MGVGEKRVAIGEGVLDGERRWRVGSGVGVVEGVGE